MGKKIIKKTQAVLFNFGRNFKARYVYIAASIGFAVALLVPALFVDLVSAYGQVTSRSIEMSSSAVSATSTSYDVTFTTDATVGQVIEGVVVDFCSNDPIIGDSCTAPTGFTVGASPTTSGSNYTGLNPTLETSWTVASANSGRTFDLTDAGATSTIPLSTVISFTINSVTNPSTLGSFYARIFTFPTTAAVTTWISTANGSATTGFTDAGGIALSTVSQITITSKVQETITFCVYTATLDLGTCNAATGTTVLLGNNNGVLSASGPFVDKTTKFDLQTNALHGAIVRFTGTTLTSGGNTIEASATSGTDGTTAAFDDASTSGSPQFGFCAFPVAGAETNLTISATYASVSSGAGSSYSGASSTCNSDTTQTSGTGSTGGALAGSFFGFNITNAASTYGDQIAAVTAGSYVQGELAFIGNISNTNVAGIYTTTLTFIATGTY